MDGEINFDERFNQLEEYYNIYSPNEVKEFLKINTGIFVLLDEVKPYLEETFADENYCLEMVYDPECTDCDQLVLKINVSAERYHNGVSEDIEYVRYNLRPLRRKMHVLTEFAIRPEVRNV